MIKKVKDKMQVFSGFFFLLSFQPFFILSNILILLFGTTKILLSFPFPAFFYEKQHLPFTYSSLTSTIFEKNMLAHQVSLKESICEEMFPITTSKQVLLPISLLAVSNSLILVNCKKCILNFTDTFNSWFCNLLL